MRQALKRKGYEVNEKRVRRLMSLMGIEVLYPRPNVSRRNESHEIYPYLLREVAIERCNQVWSTDITYVPMPRGYVYLVAVIDWHSRYVLSWEISNTLEAGFCVTALKTALRRGQPEIFNSDQGSQFTSLDFTDVLKTAHVPISMDGKGRAMDNIFVERLWRTVKYEEVYIKSYQSISEARESLEKFFKFYNQERPHQALDWKTPEEVYFSQQVFTP